MKIERQKSKWGTALHLGPYVQWQDWSIWHHCFIIGFSFGPWDYGLEVTLWDIQDTIESLKDRGMTENEAWHFCQGVRASLPDPYDKHVNLRKKIEEAFAERETEVECERRWP